MSRSGFLWERDFKSFLNFYKRLSSYEFEFAYPLLILLLFESLAKLLKFVDLESYD